MIKMIPLRIFTLSPNSSVITLSVCVSHLQATGLHHSIRINQFPLNNIPILPTASSSSNVITSLLENIKHIFCNHNS